MYVVICGFCEIVWQLKIATPFLTGKATKWPEKGRARPLSINAVDLTGGARASSPKPAVDPAASRTKSRAYAGRVLAGARAGPAPLAHCRLAGCFQCFENRVIRKRVRVIGGAAKR